MTIAPLHFDIDARSRTCAARTGRVTTRHGSFDTPAFMPVGTQGTVKGLLPWDVARTGAQIILGNTYHLMLRPGSPLIARRGGLHRFVGWPGPMLTDSGGYQAFSLSDTNTIDEDGVTFKSTIDGSMVRLTPERAIEVQNELGADIIMAFDDCPPSVDPKALSKTRKRLTNARGGKNIIDHDQRLEEALERTTRWLERCARAHARPNDQSLFGIVQGGTDLERRTRSAAEITAIDLPGYAIGGVAVGEGPEEIERVVTHTAPLLPVDKPRYLMGVGYERDILLSVRAGIDMFDCVLPTRNGRNANAFTRTGQIRLRNAKYAEDDGPIDPACRCPVCRPIEHGWATIDGRPFSRSYLRHLFHAGEMLGGILVSLHNIWHFQALLLDIRGAIRDDGWSALAAAWPVLSGRSAPPARALGGDQAE